MNEVVTMTAEHAAAAGALLAARHQRERARFPLLPSAYEDHGRAAELVRGVLQFCEGVAAIDDRGDLAGFLTSFDSEPDPTSPMARYLPERSSIHLAHGHSVASHLDAGPLYARLFAERSERAVDRGVIDFIAHVPIGDPSVEAAWAALGFGRMNVVAIRDLAPLDRRTPADVHVRSAGPDELDIVAELVDEESKFHAASPMFVPYLHEATTAAVRDQLARALASDDHAFLIANRGGSDIGIISIEPGLGSPLYVPDNAVYIAATAVVPAERGSGAGAALVDAAFTWATDHGHVAASLHFATANAMSTSFWTGVGFTPVMAHLRRRLDDRILSNRA